MSQHRQHQYYKKKLMRLQDYRVKLLYDKMEIITDR